MILELMTDVINGSRTDYDYCLGKADIEAKTWNCISKTFLNNTNDRFSYNIK